ncbi:hypothetical protein EWM64_g3571 [Hericium alpestre]|uniref:PX domain-containing protein n=1 Tax=Hericium alpestre TaxID=135208 RepID=A0A4Z0A2A7_9AGAM|nr:hypothetical protein EWM64_g3571 [Hericium alpestre]
MTAIQAVYVRGHEERLEPKSHIVYRIEIQAHVRSWQMWRRYSEFVDLHTELTKSTGAAPPAPLPPKHAFAMLRPRNNETLLEERRLGLEAYLRAICASKGTSCSWLSVLAEATQNAVPTAVERSTGTLAGRGETATPDMAVRMTRMARRDLESCE